jgi:hypothetical protein
MGEERGRHDGEIKWLFLEEEEEENGRREK